MSVLESFHKERKLSFNHWRYRLLHWAFGVDAKTPEESSLPRYLYTHYCPLFHLTNFIALFSWLILFLKVLFAVIESVVGFIADLDWSFLKCSRSDVEADVEVDKDTERKGQWLLFTNRVLKAPGANFTEFWSSYWHQFNLLDEKEARLKYSELVEKLNAAKEKAKKRQEKMRELVLFWVNFSRVFLKWFFALVYLALFVGAIWLATIVFSPVVNFLWWLFSIDLSSLIPILVIGGKFTGVALLAFAFVYALNRFGVFQKLVQAVRTSVSTCLPPLTLVGELISLPFRLIAKTCRVIVDFSRVFYEENCPPITVVSPDEEAVEKAVEESVN